jgi:hypothetical protein
MGTSLSLGCHGKQAMAAILVCFGSASGMVGQTETVLKTPLVQFELKRFAQSNMTDSRARGLASTFLRSRGGANLNYLRVSSFADGGMAAPRIRSITWSTFVEQLAGLQKQQACQVEVLQIVADSAVRWACSDRSGGRVVLSGTDPFRILDEVELLYLSVRPGDEFRVNVVQIHGLVRNPSAVLARRVVEHLAKLDRGVDWRLTLVSDPWQFEDMRFSSVNPNLLMYDVPDNVPVEGNRRVSCIYTAFDQSFMISK